MARLRRASLCVPCCHIPDDFLSTRGRTVGRAHSLHPQLSRAAHALCGGDGLGAHGPAAVRRADDGGVDAGVLHGAGVLAQRGGGHGHRAGRQAPRRREVREESLAHHHRRRAPRHREIPRLRPRDVGTHQLDRGGLCADQRRAHLHDARRPHAAPARGRDQPGAEVGEVADRPARCRRRTAPLPRPRFRHAGGFADRAGQSGGVRVHRGRQEALPGERGRGRRVRRRQRREGPRGHRAREPAHVGQAALRQVPVPEPPDRGGRRAGAQELHHADGQPLGDPHAQRRTWPGSSWRATSSSTPGT